MYRSATIIVKNIHVKFLAILRKYPKQLLKEGKRLKMMNVTVDM